VEMIQGGRQVLVVAGSDSSGGAGIVRDVETVAAFGVKSCVAVTAVTVQTHKAVGSVEAMPAALVSDQMRAALDANDVGAVKIGMLAGRQTIAAVVSVLSERPDLPVILDPVIVSSSGRRLLPSDAVATLKDGLLPLCRLVTPNLPEFLVLTGIAVDGKDAAAMARTWFGVTSASALIKGGHGVGRSAVDLLIEKGRPPKRFAAPRIEVTIRGTGCSLASAIAAAIAAGSSLERAVADAKAYVFAQLSAAGTAASCVSPAAPRPYPCPR
jgi:hydroxymethylpyrimidine/phosphomethylpyrimidine kinase